MPFPARLASLCVRDRFPTRRSSDLWPRRCGARAPASARRCAGGAAPARARAGSRREPPRRASRSRAPCPRSRRETSLRRTSRGRPQDRKSTRLNSSHLVISYAVPCTPRLPVCPRPFPYPTLFRSLATSVRSTSAGFGPAMRWRSGACPGESWIASGAASTSVAIARSMSSIPARNVASPNKPWSTARSEEHTSELQSPCNLVCRSLHASPPCVSATVSLPDALPIFGHVGAEHERRLRPGDALEERRLPGRELDRVGSRLDERRDRALHVLDPGEKRRFAEQAVVDRKIGRAHV